MLGGRYRLLDPLGEGGMSVVWRARDEVLGRTVAVKVLRSEQAADPASRAIVLTEAQATARVSHPNVTSVYDYGEWRSPDGWAVPYVVMELLSGPSLAQRLDAGAVEPSVALRVAAEVAAGLAAAHEAGLVHRDIKPGNVILSATGAKVVDFGIAALAGEPDGVDVDGRVLGTLSYLPPERLRRGVAVPASDMYAWGVLLHRLLTGRLPWPTGATLLERVLHAQSAEPLPGVPADIDGLFHRCLATDPAERPSAREAALLTGAAAGIRPALGDDPGEDPGRAAAENVTAHVLPRPAALSGATDPVHPAAFGGAADASTAPHPVRGTRLRRALAATIIAVPVAIAAAVLAFAYGPDRPAPLDDTRIGLGQPPSVAAATEQPAIGSDPVPSPTPTTVVPGETAGPVGPVGAPEPTGNNAGTPTGPAPVTLTGGPGPVTLTSPGGLVVASCQGGLVHVRSAQPAPGFALHNGLPGPDSEVEVRFRDADTDVRMHITCATGQPTFTVDRD